MKTKSSEKIAGGKLVRVELDFESKINSAKITGDFFMHPETVIEDLEKSLKGLSAAAEQIEIKNKLDKIISEKNATLYGVTTDDIARVAKTALGVKQ
ncbi:TPA: hypothetical protein H1012_00200 [archaeon]|nr:hypothetical protein [Candidatus Naiadarchaeales archaeon SRR2090153.bin461]HIK02252.1 hypothetical protein [Candidatus Naiadarchaeales archaeon SRR2090159.bin1288]